MEQHGFHKRRSCDIQYISTIYDFETSLNNSGQVPAILLDLLKGFDKVSHVRLCRKLSIMESKEVRIQSIFVRKISKSCT